MENNNKNTAQTSTLTEGVNKGNIKSQSNVDKSTVKPPPAPQPKAANKN